MKFKTTLRLLLTVLLIQTLACSPKGFQNQSSSEGSNQQNQNTGDDGTSQVPPGETASYLPLVWEPSVKDGSVWSLMLYQIILTEEPTLVSQKVSDVTKFCTRYNSLKAEQKVNFWGQLIAAVAKFESGWKPTARYTETTMGTDPVTGEQVASEGLLQLSYQDEKHNPTLCDFDWEKDRPLKATDPRKTIFDPYRNLHCGTRLLAKQIKSRHAIAISSGAYWSVLKTDSDHQKIDQIAATTKALSFCH
jgi:hypothetical protein